MEPCQQKTIHYRALVKEEDLVSTLDKLSETGWEELSYEEREDPLTNETVFLVECCKEVCACIRTRRRKA